MLLTLLFYLRVKGMTYKHTHMHIQTHTHTHTHTHIQLERDCCLFLCVCVCVCVCVSVSVCVCERVFKVCERLTSKRMKRCQAGVKVYVLSV